MEDKDSNPVTRVGEEYQVEIPSLMSKAEYLKVTEIPMDAVIQTDSLQRFFLGLPVSIMWIDERKGHMPMQCADKSNEKSNGDGSAVSLLMQQVLEPCGCCRSPVPGSMSCSWSDVEEAGFVLGLYIFGKNLTQLKKFLQSKTMEDIQSFYYGKFYKSPMYRKWSEGCRSRSRRCVFGQKIFTGWRQQELVNRLLPHVAEESKKDMEEVLKGFGEGKLGLEEFVNSLKVFVGLNVLVDAIGIGKGKQDLTGVANGPVKSQQHQTGVVRPEIPNGKSLNSLTTAEILNFLTGGYRMSKARSHDLFWEAIWPRLLDRGWHSEQPKDYFTVANSQSLVFLIPGIKKFSRRKLVKGDHYYDSIADILNKVASDPSLMELDYEADGGPNIIEEDLSSTDSEDDRDEQRHFYLKPRNVKQNGESQIPMDATIDVARAHGLNDVRNCSMASCSDSEESDEDAAQPLTELSSNKQKIGASRFIKSNGIKTNFFQQHNIEAAPRKGGPTKCSGFSSLVSNKEKIAKLGELHSKKASKGNKIQRSKPAIKAPQVHRLFATNSCIAPMETDRDKSILENRPQEMPVSCKPSTVSYSTPGNNETPSEKPHMRTWFDLNALPNSDDNENGTMVVEPATEFSETRHVSENGEHDVATTSYDHASDQSAGASFRRHGTRNRPPTARALEAVAAGYLTATHKRKCKDDYLETTKAKSSRRARSGGTKQLGISGTINAAITNYAELESREE